MDSRINRVYFLFLSFAFLGCSAAADHVVIHETPATSVWVKADPRAKTGHSHPYAITENALAMVLKGVQVEDRDTTTGLGLLGSDELRPAFTQAEIGVLVPYLTEALKKASPKDMATFYMVVRAADQRKGVTSGGLFIEENNLLHFTLANCRSIPRGGQDYTVAMEVDTRDEPLLPVTPHRFRVDFVPAEAWIKRARSENQPSFPAYGSAYEDLAKTVVINLENLPVQK